MPPATVPAIELLDGQSFIAPSVTSDIGKFLLIIQPDGVTSHHDTLHRIAFSISVGQIIAQPAGADFVVAVVCCRGEAVFTIVEAFKRSVGVVRRLRGSCRISAAARSLGGAALEWSAVA